VTCDRCGNKIKPREITARVGGKKICSSCTDAWTLRLKRVQGKEWAKFMKEGRGA
jgi:hypothetical protein